MNITKVTIINFFSILISNIIVFFSSAYFSRLIIPSEYGEIAIASTFAGIFSTVLSLQVVSSIGPALKKFGKESSNDYIMNISLFSTLIYFFLSLIIIYFSKYILNLMSISFKLLLFALTYGYGLYMVNIFTTANNFDFKPISNFFVKVSISLFSLFVSIFFIYFFDFKQNQLARIIGLGGVYFVFGILVLLYFLIVNRFNFSNKISSYIKFCLIFSLPLILNYIINDALSLTDKLMISKIIDYNRLGIYSLALSFSNVCLVIAAMFDSSFTPFYYKFLDENNKYNIFYHTNNCIELYTVITCGFILLSKEVFFLYADVKYHEGVSMIPIFATSIYFLFLNLIPMNYHFYNKISKLSTLSAVISLFTNIILNYFLIKKIGIIGAALASFLSRFCNFFLNNIFSFNLIGDRYYLNFAFYLKWIIIVFFSVVIFYLCSDYYIVRWALGIIVGTIELYRILIRKTIF